MTGSEDGGAGNGPAPSGQSTGGGGGGSFVPPAMVSDSSLQAWRDRTPEHTQRSQDFPGT